MLGVRSFFAQLSSFQSLTIHGIGMFADHLGARLDCSGLSIMINHRLLPAPSARSPLEDFVDLKVAGGDLLEGVGMVYPYGPRLPTPTTNSLTA